MWEMARANVAGAYVRIRKVLDEGYGLATCEPSPTLRLSTRGGMAEWTIALGLGPRGAFCCRRPLVLVGSNPTASAKPAYCVRAIIVDCCLIDNPVRRIR